MLRIPSPVSASSPLLRAAAVKLLVLTAAGCGDDDGGGDSPPLAEPTPTRAPRAPGPDLGTLGPDSGLGIGLQLAGVGIDTPTLLNLWDTEPYLHDGSASRLADALAQPEHLGRTPLSAQDEADPVEYLLQIHSREDATP